MFNEENDSDDQSTIRILVASDNHVGYAEKDPIRGLDSFNAFEEIVKIAEEQDVDLILLGGDIFHENKPSRQSFYKVLRSLRIHCLGDRPCELQAFSDLSVSAGDTAVCTLNFEDRNINVSIPVFCIHGNHDDPTGDSRLSALDVLQVSGLVNYFGRIPENDDIVVEPILLQKNNTKLALYGISNCRDEKIYRSFRNGKVKFMKPDLYEDEWFNLCTVHQNRAAHSSMGYLPESFLPDFLDLIVWGHEHECRIQPEFNSEQSFFVMQPGSSVATSLCAGEAVDKNIAILSISGKSFTTQIIPLRSVRQFIFDEIVLSECNQVKNLSNKENKRAVASFLIERSETKIAELRTNWLKAHSQDDEYPLPLLRIRVEYSGGFQVENPQRLSQRLVGKVANANDVFQFYMKKVKGNTTKETISVVEDNLSNELVSTDKIGVDILVKQILSKQDLHCLPEKLLAEAVFQFVEKDDREAVKNFISRFLSNQAESMIKDQVDERSIDEEIERLRIKLQLSRSENKSEMPEDQTISKENISQIEKELNFEDPKRSFSFEVSVRQNNVETDLKTQTRRKRFISIDEQTGSDSEPG